MHRTLRDSRLSPHLQRSAVRAQIFRDIMYVPTGGNPHNVSYHLKSNSQAAPYNKTIVARLCQYVAEHHSVWNFFVQPVVYAYSSQVLCTIVKTTSSLVLSRHPPGRTKFDTPTAPPTDADTETPPKSLYFCLLSRRGEMGHSADKQSKVTQQRYKRHSDSQVRGETRFRAGHLVYADQPRDRHLLWKKWQCKHIQYCSTAPLGLIASLRRHRTP